MLPTEITNFATTWDIAALATFVLSMFAYRFVLHSAFGHQRSISGAIQAQRVQWLLNMARRENRMLDAVVLGNLGQGNAFFASTSAIAVGGLAAMMGSGEKVQVLMERLPYAAKSNPVLWEVKLSLILTIFVFAFFKYAWAYRLSQYASIMVGATPIAVGGVNDGECTVHAERTARLIGLAAEHANAGLRAFYYAIAVIAWFLHPVAFMLATVWVMFVLIRRDFFSRSLHLIAGSAPPRNAAQM